MERNLPLEIQDTQMCLTSMQIDPAVEHVGLGVESYPAFSSWKLDSSGAYPIDMFREG